MINVEPVGTPELAHLWEQALAQLSLQMSRATFSNWLQPARLVAVEEGVYLVEASSQPGQAWLDQRLRPLVERTLAGLVGRPVGLRFVVNGAGVKPDREESPPAVLQEVDLPLEARVDASTGAFIGQVEFEGLWQKTGFSAIPDYAIHYWRLYLGRAFDLWELLVSEDKRDIRLMRQGALPYWTPVKQYSYRTLARLLWCSRNTLTGRLQSCQTYERRKQEAASRGEAVPELPCCGRFGPSQPRQNRQGEPTCVYWKEGLLERLFREGLLAVERAAPEGKPRSHYLRLQAWRLLPVLTPTQVSRFSCELDQQAHRQWLERYGHLYHFGVNQWEGIGAESLVPYLPRYGSGRSLLEIYCNNPLEPRPTYWLFGSDGNQKV